MRALLVISLAACAKTAAPSTTPTSTPNSEGGGASPMVAPGPVEQVVGPTAIGLARQAPDQFSVLLAVRPLVDPPQPCWTKLTQRMVAGYQVFLPHGSYFVVEGDLPRAEVERCAPVAAAPLSTHRDGDATVFETPGGSVYARWAGGLLVLGGKDAVEEGLRPAPPETTARWKQVLATMGTQASWFLLTDHRLAALVGDTVEYAFVLENWDAAKHLYRGGRFVARYATPDARAQGVELIKDWSGHGKWPVAIAATPQVAQVFDRLAAAIAQLPITENGNELAIAWDIDALGGPASIATLVGNADKALPRP